MRTFTSEDMCEWLGAVGDLAGAVAAGTSLPDLLELIAKTAGTPPTSLASRAAALRHDMTAVHTVLVASVDRPGQAAERGLLWAVRAVAAQQEPRPLVAAIDRDRRDVVASARRGRPAPSRCRADPTVDQPWPGRRYGLGGRRAPL